MKYLQLIYYVKKIYMIIQLYPFILNIILLFFLKYFKLKN